MDSFRIIKQLKHKNSSLSLLKALNVKFEMLHLTLLTFLMDHLHIFLGIRGASSKTTKTGLNCRQPEDE